MIIKYKSIVIDTASIGIKARQYFKNKVEQILNWIGNWNDKQIVTISIITYLIVAIVTIFILSKLGVI
jgi:hypothetical protein